MNNFRMIMEGKQQYQIAVKLKREFGCNTHWAEFHEKIEYQNPSIITLVGREVGDYDPRDYQFFVAWKEADARLFKKKVLDMGIFEESDVFIDEIK